MISVTEGVVANKVTMQCLMTPEQFGFITSIFEPVAKSKEETMQPVMIATLAREANGRNAIYVSAENPSEVYVTVAASERISNLFAETRDAILKFAPPGTKEKYFEAMIESANVLTDHADKVKSGKLVCIL